MTEQQKFEAWLGIRMSGAAHEFGLAAWQARASQDRSAELLGLLEALTHSLERGDLLHDDQRQAFDNACSAISKARGE